MDRTISSVLFVEISIFFNMLRSFCRHTPLILAVAAGAATGHSATAAEPVDNALDTCWSCHGQNARPKDPGIPVIQGQRADYLEKQLRDFRSGARDSQIMSSMAESIPANQVARAGAIIAALPWPEPGERSSTPEPAGIAVCRACHGDDLKGGMSTEGIAPRLAGQMAEYLADQMSAFARGERTNAKTMSAQMKALSAAEQNLIAKFLAGR